MKFSPSPLFENVIRPQLPVYDPTNTDLAFYAEGPCLVVEVAIYPTQAALDGKLMTSFKVHKYYFSECGNLWGMCAEERP